MKIRADLTKVLLRESPDEYDIVHLGDNEWGNELMKKVAMDWFTEHPDCQYVEVYEHAGWFLGYRRDGSIWSTANDTAVMDKGPRPKQYSGRDQRR